MSADNGYELRPLSDPSRRYAWGLFYIHSGNWEEDDSWFSSSNAQLYFRRNDAVLAILESIRIANRDNTEYGLHVHNAVLDAAQKEYDEYVRDKHQESESDSA